MLLGNPIPTLTLPLKGRKLSDFLRSRYVQDVGAFNSFLFINHVFRLSI